MQSRDGFCYVANSEGYRDEALKSARSLKSQMPDAEVAMLAPRALFVSDPAIGHWIELPHGREGPIIKTWAWLAPFDRVILLDTDTFVAGDLGQLFAILERFHLAAMVDVTRGYDYGLGIPAAFPEFNTGVLAFRKSAAVERLFGNWVEENDRLCRKLGVKVLNDQATFRGALWRSKDVRHASLISEYNFLASVGGVANGAVRIVHQRSDRPDETAAEVNIALGPRAFVPGFGTLRPFQGRRDWVRQYLRLSRRFIGAIASPRRLADKAGPVDWAAESEAEASRSARRTLS